MSTICVSYAIYAIFIIFDFPIRILSSKSRRTFSGSGSFPIRSLAQLACSLAISCFCIFLSGCGVQNQQGSTQTTATSQATSNTPSYQTKFPDTEVPLSQNGEWINGGTTGLDWNNCQSNPGFAFGTQPGTKTGDDSICVLSGNWNSNQSARITTRINSTSNASEELEELWVRATVAAHSITGYEVTCSISPSDPFLRISRWDGPKGNNTMLANLSTGCVNGDVVQATASGNTITVYKNGTSVLTATDSSYTSGSPGMGFYIQNVVGTAAAADAEFGVSAFSATGSASSTGSGASSSNGYSTAFPDTEDPLTQNGEWINAGTTGLDWNNCQSNPGFAFGTQAGTTIGADSICVLSGNWNTNQSAQITVKINSTTNASEELEELWVRTTIAPHSITGYQVTCSISPNDPFLRISRWNGPQGNYTVLANVSTGCVNGDIVQAAVSGNIITVYKNGTSMLTATDSSYTSGSPGMGFYIQNVVGTAAAADAEFGVSAFSATGSASSNSSPGGSSGGPISVNATSLSFGSVALNQQVTQPLTVTNSGGSAATVSVAVTGAGFSLAGATSPLTLNAGQTATLNVQFDPTTAGAASGALTITSTSSTNTMAQLSLSGTGAAHQVDLNWGTPASSSDPVAGYNIYRSAGGSSFQRLNSSVNQQTAYQDGSVQAGVTYEYYVTTVDGSGVESAPSNTITVSVP